MGLPAIIGLIIAIIILFAPIENWVSIFIYIALSFIFAFLGNNLYKVLYMKKTQKNKKRGK